MAEDWYNLSEASRKLGHSHNYINVWLQRHGEKLPKEMIFEIGGRKFISKQGISFIKNNTKKMGDRLRSKALKRSTKQSTTFVFTQVTIIPNILNHRNEATCENRTVANN